MVHDVMDKGAPIKVLKEASNLDFIKLNYRYIQGSKLVRFVRQESFEHNRTYYLVVAR